MEPNSTPVFLFPAPMTTVTNGRVTLVGISTFSTECSFPVVIYLKTSNVYDWIISNSDAHKFQGTALRPLGSWAFTPY
jgi:hypothetical protein